MKRPRYNVYWYNNVMTMVKRYYQLCDEKTIQSSIFTIAIERAIEDTLKLDDGELRMKVVELRFFKQSHNVAGAAISANVSERTVKKWSSQFIRLVGAYAGY